MEAQEKSREARLAEDFALASRTPREWAQGALAFPVALLNDHAHLERKAASNALDLLARYPVGRPAARWVSVLSAIVRDEVEHLNLVVRHLEARGGAWSKHHRNPYAHGLRKLVRRGDGPRETMDRLLVAAFIEARSHERFGCLAEACEDPELARLYRGLRTSEQGHFRLFIELATQVMAGDEVALRWNELAAHEARILADQPPGPAIHSGG